VIFEFQHRLSFPFKCHQVNRSRCHHSVPTHIRRPHHSVHTHIRCSTSLLHVKNCSCRHSSSWPSIIEARETTLLLNHSSSITLPQLLFLSYSCSITLAQSLLLCSEIKRHDDISGTRHVDNRPEITADIDDLIARNWRRDDTSIFVHFCCLLLTGYKLLVSLAANDYWLSVCSFYPTRLRSGVSVSGLQNWAGYFGVAWTDIWTKLGLWVCTLWNIVIDEWFQSSSIYDFVIFKADLFKLSVIRKLHSSSPILLVTHSAHASWFSPP